MIGQFDQIAGLILNALWRSSWQAGVLAVLVIATQRLLRERISARWRFNLWAVVILRLMIPITPHTPWSVFNLLRAFDHPATRSTRMSPSQTAQQFPPPVLRGRVREGVETLPSFRSLPTHSIATSLSTKPPPISFPWAGLLVIVWAIGVLLLAARIAISTLRLLRALSRTTIARNPGLLSLLDRCRAQLPTAQPVELRLSPGLRAPALVGWRYPRILLPDGICDTLSRDELCLVLLHELAHLKRRDVALNWLLAALQCVHWFNPLIWLAFARLRADRELACDELVLTAAAPSQSHLYGRVLVKLLETLPKSAGRACAIPTAGGVGILERTHQSMRRRIIMIAQFTHRRSPLGTLVGVIVLTALAGIGLTDRVRAEARPAVADHPKPAATRPLAVAPGHVTMTFDPSETTTLSSPPGRTNRTTTQPLNDAEALYRQFERRIPEIKLDAIGFSDVIEYLRDITNLNMIVNARALEAAGIDMNTPVSLKLRDVTLEQALRQVLEQVGGSTVTLGFGVQGNAIVISTADAVPARSRVYDIADLLGSASTTQPSGGDRTGAMAPMIQIIEKNVAPDSWRDAGGSLATITPFDTRLVITTTDMNHLEIDRLLAELRSNAR